MKPTVEMIVRGLLTQGYKEVGGSDVFRILADPSDNQVIKVFYDNYDEPYCIIIRESIEAHPNTGTLTPPEQKKEEK